MLGPFERQSQDNPPSGNLWSFRRRKCYFNIQRLPLTAFNMIHCIFRFATFTIISAVIWSQYKINHFDHALFIVAKWCLLRKWKIGNKRRNSQISKLRYSKPILSQSNLPVKRNVVNSQISWGTQSLSYLNLIYPLKETFVCFTWELLDLLSR